MRVVILGFASILLITSATPAYCAQNDPGWWLLTILEKGGPVIWPILFCSILALAISLERAFKLRYKNVMDENFLHLLAVLSKEGDFEKAIMLCENHKNMSMAKIAYAGLLRKDFGLLEMERAIESAGAHEAAILGSNLRGLGAVANLAPMLGLLGTVIGMINAFEVISTAGTGNPGLVANGISQALITTATGLVVGIPSLAAYHYFRGKADRIIHDMESVSLSFIENFQHSLQSSRNRKRSENEI